MRQTFLGLTLAVSLLAVAGAAPALAAESAPPPAWGVVDMERVATEYKGMQSLNRQFQEFQKQQEAQLQQRQQNLLLFDDERQEYLDLCAPTAAPTPERDARLAALAKLSADRTETLQSLAKNTERTPEEEEEYGELDALHKKRTQEMNALQGDAQKAVVAKYEELSKLITDSLDSAVKAVAEEKKVTIVVRKEIVLYGGLDITEDVLAKLNAAGASSTPGEADESADTPG